MNCRPAQAKKPLNRTARRAPAPAKTPARYRRDGRLCDPRDGRNDPQTSRTGEGLRPDVAFQFVVDELMLDGNARQNLATFCQTWFDDGIHRLMDLSLDKNMIDKDEYPATAEIESRCVHILAHLWNSPEAGDDDRMLDHGVERSGDARRPGAEMEMAQAARQAGQTERQAEYHYRSGAGLLAQIRALLRRRAARGAAGTRPPGA